LLVKRTLLFAAGGLLLGGIIHIAIVFLVPYYALNDAWAQVSSLGRDRQFHTLPVPEAGAEPLASLDPRMLHAICRFSLASGPVRVRAEFSDEFWSVAVFDRRGRNVYSLNDRAVERSRLDMAILTPVQVAQMRQDPPAALETAIVLELPIDSGFVLLRAFVPNNSLMPTVTGALQSADCASPL
jgi:uncharacterized membrane protein